MAEPDKMVPATAEDVAQRASGSGLPQSMGPWVGMIEPAAEVSTISSPTNPTPTVLVVGDAPSSAAGGVASYVQRIEAIDAEREKLAEDRKFVLREAKTYGFVPSAIKAVVALRKLSSAQLGDPDDFLALYSQALER